MLGFRKKKSTVFKEPVSSAPPRLPNIVSGPLPLGSSFAPTPLYAKFTAARPTGPLSSRSTPSHALSSSLPNASAAHESSTNFMQDINNAFPNSPEQAHIQQRRPDAAPPSSFNPYSSNSKDKRSISVDSLSSSTSDLPSAFSSGTKQRRASVHFDDKPLPPPKPELSVRNDTPPRQAMAAPGANASPSQHRISLNPLAPSRDSYDHSSHQQPGPKSDPSHFQQTTQPTIRRTKVVPDAITPPVRPVSILPAPSGMMSPPGQVASKKSRNSRQEPPPVTNHVYQMHANTGSREALPQPLAHLSNTVMQQHITKRSSITNLAQQLHSRNESRDALPTMENQAHSHVHHNAGGHQQHQRRESVTNFAQQLNTGNREVAVVERQSQPQLHNGGMAQQHKWRESSEVMRDLPHRPSSRQSQVHSQYEAGSMLPPGLGREETAPPSRKSSSYLSQHIQHFQQGLHSSSTVTPPSATPPSQVSGARLPGHTRVVHDPIHHQPPQSSLSSSTPPPPPPSFYSNEVSRAIAPMGQSSSSNKLSKTAGRQLPNPPSSPQSLVQPRSPQSNVSHERTMISHPHERMMMAHGRSQSLATAPPAAPPVRQPTTSRESVQMRIEFAQQPPPVQRDVNGTTSTNASNSPSKSSVSHDGSGFGFRDTQSATSLSSLESGNKLTSAIPPAHLGDNSKSEHVEVQQGEPIMPVNGKVSYSPMPAKKRGSILVDKRGRLIPRALSSPPLKAEDHRPPRSPRVREGMNSQDDEDSQEEEEHVDDTIYPLEKHLTAFPLFMGLLPYLELQDFLSLSCLTAALRKHFDKEEIFREEILEKYLSQIGYWRWERIQALAVEAGAKSTEFAEPLELNLKDLYAYMRAVNIPSHRYSDLAEDILANRPTEGGNGSGMVKLLAKASRAYTRVILRLRAQADAEATLLASMGPDQVPIANQHKRSGRDSVAPTAFNAPRESRESMRGLSRPASRAVSVASSVDPYTGPTSFQQPAHLRPKFRSPLYRPRHAPLLRVFVLSPEGPWMSDNTIVECEKELKRSCSGAKGRLSKSLLKVGDIVWNCAVTDEANLGRSVWDGNYLIDLDYTYSKMGAIPKYLHSLAYPPSYFHKVLRTGSGMDADPIVQLDLKPFGEQICANLQLLQERVAMETPQGNRHTVLRWTHRSKFRLAPVHRTANTLSIPIPGTDLFVDAAWCGSVVVETEGTNEGLAELQSRCGAAFPQLRGRRVGSFGGDSSRVFRLLRERSRPGEIWVRLVREKDRLL